MREKTVSQSGAVQALSDEASALRAELKQIVDETQVSVDALVEAGVEADG